MEWRAVRSFGHEEEPELQVRNESDDEHPGRAAPHHQRALVHLALPLALLLGFVIACSISLSRARAGGLTTAAFRGGVGDRQTVRTDRLSFVQADYEQPYQGYPANQPGGYPAQAMASAQTVDPEPYPSPSPSEYDSAAASGYGSAVASGYDSAAASGYDSATASGYGSAAASAYGSAAAPGYGSTTVAVTAAPATPLAASEAEHPAAQAAPPADPIQACLCVFDVDRTLTGKQGADCPGNLEVPGVFDSAYGGGTLHLSQLAQAIGSTFCSECKLGIVSAGDVGSKGERAALVAQLGGNARSAEERVWSSPSQVHSPLVFGCPDATKEDAVQGIVEWYETTGVRIKPEKVFFFDDHTGNTKGFAEKGFNARQVSCGSRDEDDSVLGLCGATTEEIVRDIGVTNC